MYLVDVCSNIISILELCIRLSFYSVPLCGVNGCFVKFGFRVEVDTGSAAGDSLFAGVHTQRRSGCKDRPLPGRRRIGRERFNAGASGGTDVSCDAVGVQSALLIIQIERGLKANSWSL